MRKLIFCAFLMVFCLDVVLFVSCGGSSSGVGRGGQDDDVADDDTSPLVTTTTTTTTTYTSTTAGTTTTNSSTTTTTTTIAPGFKFISAGTFLMGSPDDEPGHCDSEAQHQVTLTHNFEIQKTEVTQGQFESYMEFNPSYFPECGLDCPVESLTWYDAEAYANMSSVADGLNICYILTDIVCDDYTTGDASTYCKDHGGINVATVTLNGVSTPYDCEGYRLPTEAEWEYAARAGTTTTYPDGQNSEEDSLLDCTLPYHLDDIAWYCANGNQTTHMVGLKDPNAWGLYDMIGNVCEWTWDAWAPYSGEPEVDPTGPATGVPDATTRGGTLFAPPDQCRSANRNGCGPGARFNDYGFRIVRTLP